MGNKSRKSNIKAKWKKGIGRGAPQHAIGFSAWSGLKPPANKGPTTLFHDSSKLGPYRKERK